jgi:hypothetical protein
MDRVYEFASTPREQTGTEGVAFRFVPDPRQVEAALQLYRHAGVPASGFQGVPLFQAEGLTIKGEKERYTPLFFRCRAARARGFLPASRSWLHARGGAATLSAPA